MEIKRTVALNVGLSSRSSDKEAKASPNLLINETNPEATAEIALEQEAAAISEDFVTEEETELEDEEIEQELPEYGGTNVHAGVHLLDNSNDSGSKDRDDHDEKSVGGSEKLAGLTGARASAGSKDDFDTASRLKAKAVIPSNIENLGVNDSYLPRIVNVGRSTVIDYDMLENKLSLANGNFNNLIAMILPFIEYMLQSVQEGGNIFEEMSDIIDQQSQDLMKLAEVMDSVIEKAAIDNQHQIEENASKFAGWGIFAAVVQIFAAVVQIVSGLFDKNKLEVGCGAILLVDALVKIGANIALAVDKKLVHNKGLMEVVNNGVFAMFGNGAMVAKTSFFMFTTGMSLLSLGGNAADKLVKIAKAIYVIQSLTVMASLVASTVMHYMEKKDESGYLNSGMLGFIGIFVHVGFKETGLSKLLAHMINGDDEKQGEMYAMIIEMVVAAVASMGMMYKAGSVLFKPADLTKNLEKEVESASKEVDAASKSLQNATKIEKDAIEAVKVAKDNLAKVESTNKNLVNEAAKRVADAKSNLNLAKDKFTGLRGANNNLDANVITAKNAVKTAEEELKNAEKSLLTISKRAEDSIAAATKAVKSAEDNLKSVQTTLTKAQDDLTKATKGLQQKKGTNAEEYRKMKLAVANKLERAKIVSTLLQFSNTGSSYVQGLGIAELKKMEQEQIYKQHVLTVCRDIISRAMEFNQDSAKALEQNNMEYFEHVDELFKNVIATTSENHNFA